MDFVARLKLELTYQTRTRIVEPENGDGYVVEADVGDKGWQKICWTEERLWAENLRLLISLTVTDGALTPDAEKWAEIRRDANVQEARARRKEKGTGNDD